MKFIKRSIFLISCLLIPFFGYNQSKNDSTYMDTNQNKPKFKDKLIFGGGVGASFGNVTFINISPMIGYKISDKLLTGVNLNFSYFADRFQKGAIYGPGAFLRFMVTQELYLHSEFQHSTIEIQQKQSDLRTKFGFPMLLLGGGYFARIGSNSGIGVSILFDVIEDRRNIYRNPIIRGGIMIGI